MSKSKLTLIIDGNWLLMSRLSVLTNRYANDTELAHELKLLMAKSINTVLKTFASIDNIIFVSDGGSWRNDLEIPEFLKKEGIEYKGNREKSDDINWDMVFNAFEEFSELLQSSGITVCREGGVEGDDWCWYWSTKLNAEGTNCIIWSRDRDLTQLVNRDKNGCFTVCWNKESGLTVMNKEDEDMDFFFNMEFSENDSIYHELVTKSIKENKINPQDVVIDKILRGDAGDNIQPILTRKSKSESTKTFRISAKDIDNTINISDTDNVRSYITNLLSQKAYNGRVDKSVDDIMKHFEYNRKLVWLNESSYPQDITDIFNEYPDYHFSKDITETLQVLNAESNQVTDILNII